MMISEKILEQLNQDGILSTNGAIKFEMLDIKTNVRTKSVIGDVIQDWLARYLEYKKIDFAKNTNTQQYPDFFLKKDGVTELLEVKCFDGSKTPNFDIANFESYCQSLLDNPRRLDARYLIFAYLMDSDSCNISIKNIWLKKVWQICGPSSDWPVKFQIKKGVIYNIRPNVWYSHRAMFTPFSTRREFVEALSVCIKRYTGTNHLHKANWLQQVSTRYKALTSQDL